MKLSFILAIALLLPGLAAAQEAAPREPVTPQESWDWALGMHTWEGLETGRYFGHFVDLFAYVSGAAGPRGDDAWELAPETPVPDQEALIAFVEDRSPITELVVDTGYLAFFRGAARELRSLAHDMLYHRVRVDAYKVERNGINLMIIANIEPAPRAGTTPPATGPIAPPLGDPVETRTRATGWGWGDYQWHGVETGDYYGHLVDLFAYASGAVDPQEPGRPNVLPGAGKPALVAFIEDRSPITEALVDTGYLALFGPGVDLEELMQNLLGLRVRVVAEKHERDGLNLLYVHSISAAPRP